MMDNLCTNFTYGLLARFASIQANKSKNYIYICHKFDALDKCTKTS